MKKLITLAGFLLWPAPCLAAETTPYGSAVLQMIWALLIVLGIILLLYALIRKRFAMGATGSGSIKIREIRYLMPKKGLAIVEVRGREFLLGIGVNRIELLSPLPERQEAKEKFDKILAENL